MIHHVSISARDPQHVAKVLAELMLGRSYPLAGAVSNSFVAVGGDAFGTMIEVYPAAVSENGIASAARNQASHLLLSLPVDHATIIETASREGWRTTMHPRGLPGHEPFFYVIEFWIENRLMLELAPEEMMEEYLELIQIPVLDQFVGQEELA